MREELASLVHELWSEWIHYVASKSTFNLDGSMTISAWAVRRRERQMNTSYADLTEEEKDSDRREADRILALFIDYPQDELAGVLEEEDNRLYALWRNADA